MAERKTAAAMQEAAKRAGTTCATCMHRGIVEPDEPDGDGCRVSEMTTPADAFCWLWEPPLKLRKRRK